MAPPRWRSIFPEQGARTSRQAQETQDSGSFWYFWGILGLALGVRLVWLDLYRNFIGADAVRYLWISQHVSRGDWQLLPQLYTSPLLPALMGLLARITGGDLPAGRIIGILSNTAAVGLAMLLVRHLFPRRPILAWLTGLGLAVNHVWCRTAPFVLTDNLFYLLLMALLLLMVLMMERVTWPRAMAFGLVWGLLFLSREIGLYCGAVVFFCLVAAILWRRKPAGPVMPELVRVKAGSLPVLALMLLLWGTWYYQVLGIVSLGEGPRFVTSYTQQFDRESRHPYYERGTGSMSFFHLRPYELMEFTRFPPPGDGRYPQSSALTVFKQPVLTGRIIWDNLVWSFREFQRINLVGCLTLFILVPLALLTGRLRLPGSVYWVFLASLGVLGLHFFGPVREARHIGWFFPWLYLGLAGFTLWLWGLVQAGHWGSAAKRTATALIGGLCLFHILYPQYFKEIPRRWPLRRAPQVHMLAGELIVKNSGHGAVIASREPEVAYRSSGYWIGLPFGTAEELMEWLYLGGANYLVLNDIAAIPEEEKIFWAAPKELQEQFPELEVVADFNLTESSGYGKNGRLLRFLPQPEKQARYREQFSWAGTHPRTTGAWAPETSRPAAEMKQIEK